MTSVSDLTSALLGELSKFPINMFVNLVHSLPSRAADGADTMFNLWIKDAHVKADQQMFLSVI